MASKSKVEVVIGGKVMTLTGFESEEYLHKVAAYINNKITEFNKIESFRRQQVENRNISIQLNITDDYFKAKRQAEQAEEALEEKEKELYELKHELIAAGIKADEAEKEMKKLQLKLKEEQAKAARLEAEIDDLLKK